VPTPHGPAGLAVDAPRGRAGRRRTLLVLGHGAGGSIDAPDLLAVRAAALDAGVSVARVVQPYRLAGRRAPAPAAQLDASWLAVLAVLRAEHPRAALVPGGRSSGARVACRTAPSAGAVAVVALAFPVHPPGRPERSRLDELAVPGVPVLVVQGDRDAFGCPPPGPGRSVVQVPGTHSLTRDPDAVAAAVIDFLRGAGLARP
jgi:predicted alpha/beta-hydrolase family hydrolase